MAVTGTAAETAATRASTSAHGCSLLISLFALSRRCPPLSLPASYSPHFGLSRSLTDGSALSPREPDDGAQAAGSAPAAAAAAADRPSIGPVSELQRRMQQLGPDDDDQAARLASRLIAANHTRRAAQVLHSTATMADLTQPAVQEAVQLLHPALPADAALPRLPADAEQLILQDGVDMKRIIRSSDNGSAAGPSGWTDSLLAALVESDI